MTVASAHSADAHLASGFDNFSQFQLCPSPQSTPAGVEMS